VIKALARLIVETPGAFFLFKFFVFLFDSCFPTSTIFTEGDQSLISFKYTRTKLFGFLMAESRAALCAAHAVLSDFWGEVGALLH